jgi:hypothetical protein
MKHNDTFETELLGSHIEKIPFATLCGIKIFFRHGHRLTVFIRKSSQVSIRDYRHHLDPNEL